MTSGVPTPGRPTEYTPELGAELCRRVSERVLVSVTRDSDMPTRMTVYAWLEDDEGGGEFRKTYARAREALADHLAEEIVEISDGDADDYVTRVRKDGSVIEIDGDHVRGRDLKMKARMWFAERANSRKWGRSDQHRLAGADGGELPVAPPGAVVFIGVEPGDPDRDEP